MSSSRAVRRAVVLLLPIALAVASPAAAGPPKDDGKGGGAGKGSGASVPLTPSSTTYGPEACSPTGHGRFGSPPDPAVAGWRCTVQRYGNLSYFGASATIGSGATPTPVDVRAVASVGSGAVHDLLAPASSVTYSWTFQVLEPAYVSSRISPESTNSVALTLRAASRTCPACVAQVRQLLVGSDEPQEPTQQSSPTGHVTLVATLVDPSGAKVPPGAVDVSATLDLVSAARGVFAGFATTDAEVRTVEVSAQTTA